VVDSCHRRTWILWEFLAIRIHSSRNPFFYGKAVSHLFRVDHHPHLQNASQRYCFSYVTPCLFAVGH
jgi:hypothetical protein